MAFRWRADDGPTLNAGLAAAIFQGIRICIAIKPYISVIFQGRSGPPVPPLDPHMATIFDELKGKFFSNRKIIQINVCQKLDSSGGA